MAVVALASSLRPPHAWSPRQPGLGVYLHVPFCAERCGYCSFSTGRYDPGRMERYLTALRAEIAMVAEAAWAGDVRLETVFLGGGTPSLLEPDQLAAILDQLRRAFRLSADAEITLEANPESASAARLAGYREAGVNRISLGVQSLDDAILVSLDRQHSAREARAAFERVRAACFDNVSVDLMYGLPGLDAERWESTVRAVLDWGSEHLSAYGLTLDEGSRWHAAGVSGLPPEELVTAQFRRLSALAGDRGYEHYEISNYARTGRRSIHNQIYWRHREYLALGPSACGFLGDIRYANTRSVERYCAALESGQSPVDFSEILTPRQRLGERLILGLRLCDGVPEDWLRERRALESARLPALLDGWAERGLLERREERVRLTEEGFLLSDALFLELL